MPSETRVDASCNRNHAQYHKVCFALPRATISFVAAPLRASGKLTKQLLPSFAMDKTAKSRSVLCDRRNGLAPDTFHAKTNYMCRNKASLLWYRKLGTASEIIREKYHLVSRCTPNTHHADRYLPSILRASARCLQGKNQRGPQRSLLTRGLKDKSEVLLAPQVLRPQSFVVPYGFLLLLKINHNRGQCYPCPTSQVLTFAKLFTSHTTDLQVFTLYKER